MLSNYPKWYLLSNSGPTRRRKRKNLRSLNYYRCLLVVRGRSLLVTPPSLTCSFAAAATMICSGGRGFGNHMQESEIFLFLHILHVGPFQTFVGLSLRGYSLGCLLPHLTTLCKEARPIQVGLIIIDFLNWAHSWETCSVWLAPISRWHGKSYSNRFDLNYGFV